MNLAFTFFLILSRLLFLNVKVRSISKSYIFHAKLHIFLFCKSNIKTVVKVGHSLAGDLSWAQAQSTRLPIWVFFLPALQCHMFYMIEIKTTRNLEEKSNMKTISEKEGRPSYPLAFRSAPAGDTSRSQPAGRVVFFLTNNFENRFFLLLSFDFLIFNRAAGDQKNGHLGSLTFCACAHDIKRDILMAKDKQA